MSENSNAQKAPWIDNAFKIAQRALGSEAAASLRQMAARQAAGSDELAQLVRERQDLVLEWRVRDQALSATRSRLPGQRDAGGVIAPLPGNCPITPPEAIPNH